MNQLEITNQALLRLGVDPIGNVNDLSKNAKAAALAYPRALASVMRAYEWPLAMRRGSLGNVDNSWVTLTDYEIGEYIIANGQLYRCSAAGTSGAVEPFGIVDFVDGTVTWAPVCAVVDDDEFPNRYLYPDCAKLCSVSSGAFRLYGRLVYSASEPPLEARYVAIPDISDPVEAGVEDCVALRLAYLLAAGVGHPELSQVVLSEYLLQEKKAIKAAASESREPSEPEPFWTDNV